MARYDLYKDIAQAGQIAQAYKRDIKTYSSNESDTLNNADGLGLGLGVPVHMVNDTYIASGGSLDLIIGITCFSPLLINPEVFYHYRRDQVPVLTKGRIYVRVQIGASNVNEFDIAYIDGNGKFSTRNDTSHKEIGIFLSSAKAEELVILQFDLSTHAVGGL